MAEKKKVEDEVEELNKNLIKGQQKAEQLKQK